MLACMSVCVDQVIAVDKTKNTMRVGAGMRYTEFLKEAQKAGMSVQVCVCVWYREQPGFVGWLHRRAECTQQGQGRSY